MLGEIVDLGEEGVARKWATTKVPPLLPLPTWCTWVNVCARVGAPEYIPKKSSPRLIIIIIIEAQWWVRVLRILGT